MMYYIVLDPSGSYNEGKGHTGIAIMHDDDWNSLHLESVSAKRFPDRHAYWENIMLRVTEMVKVAKPEKTVVIIESFMIRNNGFLIGKMPETIRLIGALEYRLEEEGIDFTFQTPSQAKSRFHDDALCRHVPLLTYNAANHRYYFKCKMCNDHVRDALKHLLYYKHYVEPKAK